MKSDDTEGHSIDLIQNYLRDNFKKPRIGVIARILGESRDYDYRIIDTEKHSEHGCLISSRLIWVSVADSYLDLVRLPVPRSWGLFALNDDDCLHLSSRIPENFSKLLGREQDISAIPAESLAILFCDAVLSTKDLRHSLLKSIESINDYILVKEDHTLDLEEFEKLKKSFQQISRSEEGCLTIVNFTTICRSFSDSSVHFIRLEINQDRIVTYVNQLFTQNLFHKCHAQRR